MREGIVLVYLEPDSRCKSYIDISVNSYSKNSFWLEKTNKRGSQSSFTTSSFSDKCDFHILLVIFWKIIYVAYPLLRSSYHLLWCEEASIEMSPYLWFIVCYRDDDEFLTTITLEIICILCDLFHNFLISLEFCSCEARCPATCRIDLYTAARLPPTHRHIMSRCEPKYPFWPDNPCPFCICIREEPDRMEWSICSVYKRLDAIFLCFCLVCMMSSWLEFLDPEGAVFCFFYVE
jgi:hypothetical protein